MGGNKWLGRHKGTHGSLERTPSWKPSSVLAMHSVLAMQVIYPAPQAVHPPASHPGVWQSGTDHLSDPAERHQWFCHCEVSLPPPHPLMTQHNGLFKSTLCINSDSGNKMCVCSHGPDKLACFPSFFMSSLKKKMGIHHKWKQQETISSY